MIDTLLITYETVETILHAVGFLLVVGIAIRLADLSKKKPAKKTTPEHAKEDFEQGLKKNPPKPTKFGK